MISLRKICEDLGWGHMSDWSEFIERVREIESECIKAQTLLNQIQETVAEENPVVQEEPVEKPVETVEQFSMSQRLLQDALAAVDSELQHFANNVGATSLLNRVRNTLTGNVANPISSQEAQNYADGAGRVAGKNMWTLVAQVLNEREHPAQTVEQAKEHAHEHSHDSVQSQLHERFGKPPPVTWRQESHSHQNDHPERIVNPVLNLRHNGSGEILWDMPEVNWEVTEKDNLWYTIYTDTGNGWERADASFRESWGQRSTFIRHKLIGSGGKARVKIITSADGTTKTAESEIIFAEMHDPTPSAVRNLRYNGAGVIEWDAPYSLGDGSLYYGIMMKHDGGGWSKIGKDCRESLGERSTNIGFFLRGKSASVKVISSNRYGRSESNVIKIQGA